METALAHLGIKDYFSGKRKISDDIPTRLSTLTLPLFFSGTTFNIDFLPKRLSADYEIITEKGRKFIKL